MPSFVPSQGAFFVDEYCRKMKSKADALADLGEPVNDRTLVLNVLWGLNERFQFMAQLVTRQRPFPHFGDVHTDLRLAELNMASPPTPPSALIASSTSKTTAPSTTPAPAHPSPGHPFHRGTPGGGRGRRRRGGRGQGALQVPSGRPSIPGMAPSKCGLVVLALLYRVLVFFNITSRRTWPVSITSWHS